MTYENVLVNFRIPVALKNEFEDACKRLHMPMTAQANLLMREFVNRQKKARHEPNELNELNEPFNFYSGMDDPL